MITEGQLLFQRRLNEEFSKVRISNPRFSLRAFSLKVGLSPAALSEILKGKRSVSKNLAQRTLSHLPQLKDANDILNLLEAESKMPDSAPRKALSLTLDTFHVISDWRHFAIMSLMETADFKSDSNWIAKRLRIKLNEVEHCLERLERIGIIEKSGNRLKLTGNNFDAPDEIASSAIKQFHSDGFDLARHSMQTDELDERDFISCTVTSDPQKLKAAKKMIRDFRNKLCTFLESGDKKEVYLMSVQLFPLTKGESK